MGNRNKGKNNQKRSGRNTAKQKGQIIDTKCNTWSKEQFVELQAEAYYLAMKRIEMEKAKEGEGEKSKTKLKWWESILMFLNVLFFPWKMLGKRRLRKQIYDGLLVIPISSLLQVGGTATWLIGAVGLFLMIIKKLEFNFNACIFLILLQLLSSIMIASGKAFGEEKDSTIIYAYSASFLALVSCIINIVAIFLR